MYLCLAAGDPALDVADAVAEAEQCRENREKNAECVHEQGRYVRRKGRKECLY